MRLQTDVHTWRTTCKWMDTNLLLVLASQLQHSAALLSGTLISTCHCHGTQLRTAHRDRHPGCRLIYVGGLRDEMADNLAAHMNKRYENLYKEDLLYVRIYPLLKKTDDENTSSTEYGQGRSIPRGGDRRAICEATTRSILAEGGALIRQWQFTKRGEVSEMPPRQSDSRVPAATQQSHGTQRTRCLRRHFRRRARNHAGFKQWRSGQAASGAEAAIIGSKPLRQRRLIETLIEARDKYFFDSICELKAAVSAMSKQLAELTSKAYKPLFKFQLDKDLPHAAANRRSYMRTTCKWMDTNLLLVLANQLQHAAALRHSATTFIECMRFHDFGLWMRHTYTYVYCSRKLD